MKQPVITIEEPNGHIRYAVLPYFLHEDADIEDMIEMVNLYAIWPESKLARELSLA